MVSDLARAINFHKKYVAKYIFDDIQAAMDREANFLAALGLVCYTEFLGGLARGTFAKNQNHKNFDCFFDRLGEKYRDFGQTHEVYSIYRCGLVHQYFIKVERGSAIIYTWEKSDNMLGAEASTAFSAMAPRAPLDETRGPDIAVGVEQNGRYYFVVETYFRDFQKAARQLLEQVKTDQDALRLFVKALDSVKEQEGRGD